VAKLTLTFTPFQSNIKEKLLADKKHKSPHATQCKVDNQQLHFMSVFQENFISAESSGCKIIPFMRCLSFKMC
jgi:hypothetical protein